LKFLSDKAQNINVQAQEEIDKAREDGQLTESKLNEIHSKYAPK